MNSTKILTIIILLVIAITGNAIFLGNNYVKSHPKIHLYEDHEFEIEWEQTFEGTGFTWATTVIETSDGGFIAAGYIPSGRTLDYDMLVLKTDINGKLEWNRTYGGNNWDGGSDIIETSDGDFVITGVTTSYGSGEEDMWLIKINSTGNALWNQTYGGTGDDLATALLNTYDGSLVLVGRTDSFGYGHKDIWLVKTDSTGKILWNQTYGGSGSDEALDLIQTPDGGFAMIGYTDYDGNKERDLLFVRVDSEGTLKWERTYGGSEYDAGSDLISTMDGGFALVGSHTQPGDSAIDGGDVWLVKTDSEGRMEWDNIYGGPYSESGSIILENSDGGFTLVGSTTSFGAGQRDIWLMKTNSMGTLVWNKTLGGEDRDLVWETIQTSDDGFLIAGASGSDLWLVKLKAINFNNFIDTISEDKRRSFVNVKVSFGLMFALIFSYRILRKKIHRQ